MLFLKSRSKIAKHILKELENMELPLDYEVKHNTNETIPKKMSGVVIGCLKKINIQLGKVDDEKQSKMNSYFDEMVKFSQKTPSIKNSKHFLKKIEEVEKWVKKNL